MNGIIELRESIVNYHKKFDDVNHFDAEDRVQFWARNHKKYKDPETNILDFQPQGIFFDFNKKYFNALKTQNLNFCLNLPYLFWFVSCNRK